MKSAVTVTSDAKRDTLVFHMTAADGCEVDLELSSAFFSYSTDLADLITDALIEKCEEHMYQGDDKRTKALSILSGNRCVKAWNGPARDPG